jgi:replicative DNA helicase
LEEVKKLKSSNELFSDQKEELSEINQIDDSALGNEEYLLDLVEAFAKEQSMKEAIIESAELVKKKRFSDIEDVMRDALSVNRNVDLGLDYFSTIDERWQRFNKESVDAKFQTNFESLNQALEGGLAAKELAMVVAPPGVGKSLYLANQAVRSCLDGHNVLYISLEMSEDRVAQRLDSIFTRIRQSDLRDRKDKLKERLDIISDMSELGKIKIKEFPTKRASINSLRSYLNQLRNYEDFTPDVIVVDYLELMLADTQLAEYQAQERLAQELRGLAIEHECLLWTATQTNREGKKVTLITDTELADSYGKTRVCDLVFSINQTEEEFDKGESRIYVIKSRNGKARFVIPATMDYQRLVIGQKK